MTLTYCLDAAARYPLGYYLGFEPPSYLVMTCLYQAICPKPEVPDESLPSWLIRLAQANCYHSAKMVLQLCRERLSRRDSITQPTRTATYQVLAELTRVAADEL